MRNFSHGSSPAVRDRWRSRSHFAVMTLDSVLVSFRFRSSLEIFEARSRVGNCADRGSVR